MSIKKLFTHIKNGLEPTSYAVLIFSFIFAIIQYDQLLDTNKVKETLSYEERLNNGKFLEAKVSIAKAWHPYQFLFEELKQKGISSQKDKKKIIEQISKTVIKEKKLSHNIDLMVDFYESLNICIKNNICDQKTALFFFTPYAKRFYTLHRFYIDNKSKTYIDNYANGLKELLKEK